MFNFNTLDTWSVGCRIELSDDATTSVLQDHHIPLMSGWDREKMSVGGGEGSSWAGRVNVISQPRCGVTTCDDLQPTASLQQTNMENIRENAVAALHRTMVVLREELEMKNRMIIKLLKRKHYKTPKSVNKTVAMEDLHHSYGSLLGAARRLKKVN